jgi:hypothetical protein
MIAAVVREILDFFADGGGVAGGAFDGVVLVGGGFAEI